MSSRKREREQEKLPVGKVESIEDLLTLLRTMPQTSSTGKVRKSSSSRRTPVEYGMRRLIRPLERLQNMVGMTEVKKTVLSQLLYFMQGLHGGKLDMLHSVIQGPPGVGKSELAHILADLYCSLGILETSRVVTARRSDLIGKYLGHTADKTQSVIDDSLGGVLLIDEAYSLGNDEGRDSFAKECLDTLNQNLTENADRFFCVIAGYEKALDECFFAMNEGLSRRFNFRYTISGYSAMELREIFIRIVSREGWLWEEKGVSKQFFEQNHKNFPFFGGDMESLFVHVKLAHAKHLMTVDDKTGAKTLTEKDLMEGFRNLMVSRNDKHKDSAPMSMYL